MQVQPDELARAMRELKIKGLRRAIRLLEMGPACSGAPAYAQVTLSDGTRLVEIPNPTTIFVKGPDAPSLPAPEGQ
jgi:hypothetical protein